VAEAAERLKLEQKKLRVLSTSPANGLIVSKREFSVREVARFLYLFQFAQFLHFAIQVAIILNHPLLLNENENENDIIRLDENSIPEIIPKPLGYLFFLSISQQ
jgi:hypothetical protein